MGQYHLIQNILDIGKQDFCPQFETPYKFNGKEKDQETGYQYFGARYLNPTLSIWLSVDPMSDKYPHLTSYNYCANNPVMLIDPDGRDIDPASESDPYIQEQVQKNAAFAKQYNGLKNDHSAVFSYKKMEGPIAEVVGNETKYTYGNIECEGKNDIGQAKISINYTVGEYKDEPNENWVLYEETAHVGQYVNGDWGFGRTTENGKWSGSVGLDKTDEVNAKNWAAKALNIPNEYNLLNLDKNYKDLSPIKMSAEEGHINSYPKSLNVKPNITYDKNGAYSGGSPFFIYKKPENSN